MSKFFLVSGESSGDFLGSIVISCMIDRNPSARFYCWGGEKIKKSGGIILQYTSTINLMGWSEVLKNLWTFKSLLKKCKSDILKVDPDKIILIDYGGFNLRIAKWAKKYGYHVDYLSPPKVWASRERRIHQLKKYCDQIIVLFPFEKEYFYNHHPVVHLIGHPLSEILSSFLPHPEFYKKYNLDNRPILAILPGSRPSEIHHNLPTYLKAIQNIDIYQICISSAKGRSECIHSILGDTSYKVIKSEDYHDLLHFSKLCITTSGTASLEVALHKTPQIVCFKTSKMNYWIAKQIVKTKFISLPNLIMNEAIIPELIQDKCTPTSINVSIKRINEDQQITAYETICNQCKFKKDMLIGALSLNNSSNISSNTK